MRRVMLLVGKGHHVFVATVCKEWQEYYNVAHPSAKTSVPSVVESVKRVHWAKQCGYGLGVKTFRAAAEYGDVSMCKELHLMRCPWDRTVCEATLKNAKHGLRILRWLRSEDLPKKRRCTWSEHWMGVEAGKWGNVEVLEWLLSDECEGFPSSWMWLEAVKAGHLDVLKVLVHHPKIRAKLEAAGEHDQWKRGALWAAHAGNLEVLQWLYVNARELCTWAAGVCFCGVYHAKSLSVLKWLRSEEVMCPWDDRACPQILKDRSRSGWDMLPAAFEEMKQWVHSNGHPCNCQD